MTTPNTVDALAREISRWNFDATDTQILVCKDQHDKCAPCEYETLSPAEAVRIIDELRCAVLEASARAWLCAPSPSAVQPLSEAVLRVLFQALQADPRSKQFSPENWFVAGSSMTEAQHGFPLWADGLMALDEARSPANYTGITQA